MPASLPLNLSHFHFIPHSSLPPPPLPTKDNDRRTSKPLLKSPSTTTTTPIPFQTPRNHVLGRPLQYPEANPPGSLSVESLADPKTVSLLLQSCSSLDEVKCIHAITLRLLETPATFVDNNLISSYVRFSSLVDARKVFDRMRDRNVVSWTAVLNGHLKLGLDCDVVRLFNEMTRMGVRANGSTFVCLLKACGNTSNIELGRQIHACVVKGNWSNLIVDTALLCFYAQCADLFSASLLFDWMPIRDVMCWTTMITAYAQYGRGDEAFLMFSYMQHHGLRPNEFTVCSVLKACGKDKVVRFGRQLHGAIVKGVFEDDVFVGSSLLSMYSRCGEVSDARLVFDLMPKRNTITWTSMISGFVQNGLGEEGILLFRRMKTRRVFANNITAVSILSACGSIGSLYLGKEVHAQILKSSVHENIHIGSTLVWLYCKCEEFAYAARVLEAMPARDVISWTAIISGYTCLGHGSEALRLLNNMLLEGVEPNSFTYSSALKACAKLEAVSYGQRIHASANKTRALSNVFVSSALINMYMKCGCIADASRIFDAMPERNLVSWKAMVVGYAKNGHCSEALKLMYQMQAEGLFVDDFVLSTVLNSCGDFHWESECPISS